MNNIEILFLEKLINFNTTNFEGYIKNLNEIKKKLQNDNNIEEEEKEDVDINDSISKKTKNENISENKELKEKKSKKNIKIDKNKAGKAIKQKKNKIKIMSSFFVRNNIFFIIQIVFIMLTSLSYYIITIVVELQKRKELIKFDEINNDIISTFKISFDIYMNLKKELEYFEETLDNCRVTDKKYKMNVPTIDNLPTPSLGNSIMQITGDFGFKGEPLSNFKLLFVENACKSLSSTNYAYYMCVNYFSDYLFQGIENTINKINSGFGTIIEEFNQMNKNGSLFIEYMNHSKFHSFEIFVMYYYQNAIIIAEKIFNSLRLQELNNILFLIKIISYIYIIIAFILFCFVIYLINRTKTFTTPFLYFIGILPFKYLIEDEKFYKEIITFGKKFF